jgi:hypothetical protein
VIRILHTVGSSWRATFRHFYTAGTRKTISGEYSEIQNERDSDADLDYDYH